MSYKFVALRDVCDITMGQAPSGDTYNTDGKGLPLIAGAGDFGALSPKPSKFTAAPTKTSKPGDIILCIRATIGDLNWSDTEYCLGRGVAGLSCDPETLNQSYLWHWLGYAAPELKAKGRGAIFLQVSKADIEELRIPLPPLPEQRRIAAILDKADALRTKRCEAIAKLDQLLQSVFLDMFGDPVTNPKGWPVVPVGEVFCEFIGGKNIQCPDESTSPYRILKVSAVTQKIYRPEESKPAPDDFSPPSSAIVRKGDLLFSRANTTDLVAATAFVWATPENIVLPDKIWKMQVAQDSNADILFLWELFKNSSFRSEISKRSSGTSGSMKNIAKSKLILVPMPLPPTALQQRFARLSAQIEQQKRRLQHHARQLDTLFASLQQHAFAGTL